MASEDVIELGSSEDETEHKKVKPKRNAMVCIPGNLSAVTLKKKPVFVNAGSAVTVKKIINPKSTSIGPAITVKKVSNLNAKNISKANGKPMQVVPIAAHASYNQKGVKGVNPLNLFKKNNRQNNGQAPSTSNDCKITRPIKIMPVARQLPTLPPSITVKKTVPIPNMQIPNMAIVPRSVPTRKRLSGPAQTRPLARKKRKLNPAFVPKEVLTVELDDDESSVSALSNPPWYIRPEDHSEQTEMEEQNNAEPKSSRVEEIVIEDSPVKPVKDKRMYEIEVELPITIEDSPAKGTDNKESKMIASDNDEVIEKNEEPHSRKKLVYPKQSKIEIEISPMEVDDSADVVMVQTEDVEKNKIGDEVSKKENDVEFKGNEKKSIESQNLEPAKHNSSGNTETNKELSEFHPVYQSFIDICFKYENTDDMKKIVDKKIKAYYKQVPKEYTESEQFLDFVSSKISLINACPEKMYLYIKDVVDELNLQRKMTRSQLMTDNSEKKDAESFLYGEESEFDAKRQRQIKKLEKTLKKLHRAIQKLEEQEVDFDDEEDSVYLLTERYKERMVRVHAKFCQLTNTKMPSEPRIVIEARPGQPVGPAKRIEKWINKKVPIGTPLPFPDFHDVLRCVREANDEDKLGWNEADIMEEARDLFTRCGKKLQRRRQENEWRLAASRMSSEHTDPAEVNETLKKKLDENRQVATKKEAEVFNKFADRQFQLKLEAEEIGDKEAEESPVESEDDEPENADLGDKERRKERLKRLIQEKSVKKVSADKKDKPVVSEEATTNETETITDTRNENVVEKPSEVTEEKDDKNTDSESVNMDVSVDSFTKNEKSEQIQSISEESDKIGSDIDELHLLQKLHSENEINSSTPESSDNDSPIDISDTLDSGDNKTKNMDDDVISIENSSYSEEEQETANLKSDKTHETFEIKPRENTLHKTTENVLAISEENCEQKESKKTTELKSEHLLRNDELVKLSKDTIALSEKNNCGYEDNNPSSIEIHDTIESEDLPNKGQTVCEQENVDQHGNLSIVEICEESSVDSGESKKPLAEEHEISAENMRNTSEDNYEEIAEDENPSSVEFCENSSVESCENIKQYYEECETSNENNQTLLEKENNENVEKPLCSVELCDSSSVELCENNSPIDDEAAKIEDSKTDKIRDYDKIQPSILKELTEKVELVSDSKTYNVIDQDSVMKEVEIAHGSPDDNFNSKQENSKNIISDISTKHVEKNMSDLQTINENFTESVSKEVKDRDCMDVDYERETLVIADEKMETNVSGNNFITASSETVEENDTFEQALQSLQSNL